MFSPSVEIFGVSVSVDALVSMGMWAALFIGGIVLAWMMERHN